jgi:hypothetical protein
MSTFPPFAIPTPIPGDINVRTTRVSTIYPTQTVGPYTTWKLPVRLATTANISPLQGLPNVDGVTVKQGDRILVKNQTTASENGIYVVFSSNNTTLADFWLRANDLPNGSSAANMVVFVNEGTVNADLMFICTNNVGSDIVNTDNLVYTTYGVPVVPAGNNGDVQYNNSGVFGGSDLFKFSTASIPVSGTFPVPVMGQITLGPVTSTPPTVFGQITGPNATTGSGNPGTPIVLSGGKADGAGLGGTASVIGGYSASGIGGTASLTGGAGVTGGTVTLQGGAGSTLGGYITLQAGTGPSGGGINISSGTGSVTVGGDINITAHTGVTQGGNISLITGGSPAISGNITLFANGSGSTPGVVDIITNGTTTVFTKGGVSFTKDTSLTTGQLVLNPTVTTTERQGIITCSDSLVPPAGFATITVNNVNVLANDVVYVCVQSFSVPNAGVPILYVSSVTTGTGFVIAVYNPAAGTMSGQIQIAFQLM